MAPNLPEHKQALRARATELGVGGSLAALCRAQCRAILGIGLGLALPCGWGREGRRNRVRPRRQSRHRPRGRVDAGRQGPWCAAAACSRDGKGCESATQAAASHAASHQGLLRLRSIKEDHVGQLAQPFFNRNAMQRASWASSGPAPPKQCSNVSHSAASWATA